MSAALIERIFQNEKQTLGVLAAVNDNGELFSAKSLELSWKNNQANISCIPAGMYECKYTRSNRLSQLKGTDFYTYEILNVPNRSGIRLHSANYFFHLLGCISLGSKLKDLNLDQQLDVVHSGNTIKAFEDFMNRKDFVLTVKDLF